MPNGGLTPGGSTPVPDPTLLTTQQLYREVTALRELLEQRLNAMDTAVALLRDTTDRFPTRLDEKIAALKEVTWEKLAGVQVQFTERDTRASQGAISTKTAVDAALQAAKELVSAQNLSSAQSITKSEEATTKQFDQQGRLIETKTQSLETQIADLKERLTRFEGKGEGSVSSRTGTQQMIGLAIGAAGILVAVLASGVFSRPTPVAPPTIIVQPSASSPSSATTTETSRTTSTGKGTP